MFSHPQLEEFNQFLNTQVTKKVCPGFDRHSVFLTKTFHVYTRGLNSAGQLGLGDTNDRYRHRGHLMPTRVLNLENIIDIGTGTHHTLCLNRDGQVYAFGRNANGELGLGDKEDKSLPCLIEKLKDRVIVSMKTNICVSYFLDVEGNVYSCGGFYDSAALGLGEDQENKVTSPKKILNLPPIKEIIPCGDDVFFLSLTGDVYGCGSNYAGQLGLGNNKSHYEPTKLNLPPVRQVDGCREFAVFLTEEGSVFISGKLAGEKLLTGLANTKSYSLVKLNINPIIKFKLESELIFISEDEEVFIYCIQKPSCLYQEDVDFLEYNLTTIPDEINKTLNYSYFHAPLFKVEKNSMLEKECHAKVDADDDLCLRNQLTFKHQMPIDLADNAAPYIKKVSQETNIKKTAVGEIPSLKLLSALCFINHNKNLGKLSENKENKEKIEFTM